MLTSEALDAAYDAGYMAGEDATNPHTHPGLRQEWNEGHRAAFYDRSYDTPVIERISTREFILVALLAAAIGVYITLQ